MRKRWHDNCNCKIVPQCEHQHLPWGIQKSRETFLLHWKTTWKTCSCSCWSCSKWPNLESTCFKLLILSPSILQNTHTHMHTSEMVYWQNINMPHLHLLSKDCHCLLVRRIYPNGFRFRPRDVDVQLGRRCPGVTYQYLDPPRTKYP